MWDFLKLRNFNPLPPCGGRLSAIAIRVLPMVFQSTPSVWRETGRIRWNTHAIHISIHSLRVEGDLSGWHAADGSGFQSTPSVWRETASIGEASIPSIYFNPLPPCGGRLRWGYRPQKKIIFQSTPSVWRETWATFRAKVQAYLFQSTPSVWRETPAYRHNVQCHGISIHSLRVEGDCSVQYGLASGHISIHSLRVEGDCNYCTQRSTGNISIHSLRVEGDR